MCAELLSLLHVLSLSFYFKLAIDCLTELPCFDNARELSAIHYVYEYFVPL